MNQTSILQINSEHKLRSENLPFDIDVWYPLVEQFTFPSVFLPLTRLEAMAILHYQETRYLSRIHLTNDDITTLRQLEHKIDHELKQPLLAETGAFLRLCGRSPKDGEPLNHKNVIEKYEKELQNLIDNDSAVETDPNTKLRAISRVSYLCVRNGSEAMSLLLSSERVYTDLNDWIEWGEPEQIVLRRFENEMSLEYEFRAYINNHQLNAISQYDHYTIYPNLFKIKEQIKEKIVDLWHQVHSLIGEQAYVIDFVYLAKTDRMLVIELSPFRVCTGSALFSWITDNDVLRNGPFEFRLNSKLHANIQDIIEVNWYERWCKHLPKYWELYDKFEQKSSLFSWIFQLITETYRRPNHLLLFVYGTLKRGFHWNKKFLSQAKFISKAVTTTPIPLVIGECGVPYLLLDHYSSMKCVKGEIWTVDQMTLCGLDEYEGVNKGYYTRKTVNVKQVNNNNEDDDSNTIFEANAYFKVASSEQLTKGPFLDEYTLEYHKTHYKPIRHIHVKQLQYLGEADVHEQS